MLVELCFGTLLFLICFFWGFTALNGVVFQVVTSNQQNIKNWILEQPKRDCQMVEYDKGGGRRLLVGYTDDRAKKDAYNREKGIRRLEKAYKHGALTKGNINKR